MDQPINNLNPNNIPPVTAPIQNTEPVKKGISLLLILFFIVLFSAGAFFLGQYLEKNKKSAGNNITAQITTIPTAIPTIDPTAGWKTYTNIKEEYMFKYPNPPNWNIKEEQITSQGQVTTNVTIYNYNVDKAPGRSFSPSIDGNLFKIGVYLDKKNNNVNNWFENQKQIKDPDGNLPEYLNVKSITVASQKGIYFETKDMTGIMVGSAAFETPQKNLIILHGGLNFQANKNYFDQVLSTFKFTDTSQTDATTRWKSYTNITYKYSLKYPEEWEIKTFEQSDDFSLNALIIGPTSNFVFNIYKIQTLSTGNELNCKANTDLNRSLGQKVEPIKIANYDGWKSSHPNGQNPAADWICFDKEDKMYEFALHHGDIEENKNTLYQILTSFKFLQ